MHLPLPRKRTLASILLAASLLAGACGSTTADVTADTTAGSSDVALVGALVEVSANAGFFDSSLVHDLAIDFDQDDYTEMVTTYETEGEKDWIEATVTVDGTIFENAGVRLKGNSSLRGLTLETADNPEDLPWLIKLDKYADEQNYQGINDIVIRANSTETSLNEAVAQELLALAGLAAQDPVSTTFTVNGSDTELRLAIEHPDEVWEEDNFDTDQAALYKADSTGDYSYRGTDWESYDDIFNQKVGEDDLDPLIAFLDFINNSDDATFAAELDQWLDVESFATYLAFQDLIQNGDDIDGRGNNSYLHYSYDTELFTVVSWDLNLAFNTANVDTGGAPGQAGGPVGDATDGRPARPEFAQGAVPADGAVPAEGAVPADGGLAGPLDGAAAGQAGVGLVGSGGNNILSTRFLADNTFSAAYDQAVTDLTETLFASGAAADIVARWTDLLSVEAADLVPVATIDADATAISNTFPAI